MYVFQTIGMQNQIQMEKDNRDSLKIELKNDLHSIENDIDR